MSSSPAEGYLCGLGTPLLKIKVVYDGSFSGVDRPEQLDFFLNNIAQPDKTLYIASGCVRNCLDIAGFLLREQKMGPKVATVFGSIGSDQYGTIYKEKSNKEHLNNVYQEYPEIQCTDRKLYVTASINPCWKSFEVNDASQHFNIHFLLKSENWAWIEKAHVFYTSGSFVASSPDAILKIGEHLCEHPTKLLTLYLESADLCDLKIKAFKKILPYVNTIFATTEQLYALGRGYFGQEKIQEMSILKLSTRLFSTLKNDYKLPQKRTLIVLNEHEPGICFVDTLENVWFNFSPVEINEDNIKYFVGTYLAKLTRRVYLNLKVDVSNCINHGLRAFKICTSDDDSSSDEDSSSEYIDYTTDEGDYPTSGED